MQNMDQVFLYMKDEMERQAQSEEKAILDEVKKLEEEAYESMKLEAKRDADLRLKQDVEEMTSQAASEISESHIERTKKLIKQRDEYMQSVFAKAKEKLIEFADSQEYLPFVEAKIQKVAHHFQDLETVIYVSKKDLSLKDKIVSAFGSDVRIEVNDEITLGGFIIENKKLSLISDETLDFALENQKEWFNKNSGLIVK